MATVWLSAQARLDLLSTLEHLANVAGPHIARRYDDSFKRVIENLSSSAGTGSPRPHLGPETRVTSVAPYDGGPRSDSVHVLRILHGHRNITPELIARGRQFRS